METKAMDQTVFTNTGIPKNVIDAVLRMGSNRRNSIYRIVYDFMVPQPAEKHTSFVNYSATSYRASETVSAPEGRSGIFFYSCLTG